MIHGNVELVNVAEAVPTADGGVALHRIPESVRRLVNAHAQERMLDATCMEIRFVIEEGPAALTLRSPAGNAQVHFFFGDFQTGQVATVGTEPCRIPIQTADWFLKLERADLGRTDFSHRVCRACLGGAHTHFVGIEGQVRPPRADEVPSVRYLAYGTSITQGAGASLRHLCYAAQAARRLGADLINLGVGSSAWCEPELADYVAAREDWDIATVEPTANMRHFPLAEYEARLTYWARTLLAGARPRPVVFLGLLPLTADIGPAHQSPKHGGTPDEYRAAMRRVVAACAHPNLHHIEGRDLLPDFRGLGPDMLHPKDHGHILIGQNLAARLRPLLPDTPVRAQA